MGRVWSFDPLGHGLTLGQDHFQPHGGSASSRFSVSPNFPASQSQGVTKQLPGGEDRPRPHLQQPLLEGALLRCVVAGVWVGLGIPSTGWPNTLKGLNPGGGSCAVHLMLSIAAWTCPNIGKSPQYHPSPLWRAEWAGWLRWVAVRPSIS